MPVWRFTTFEDSRRALLLETGDPSLPERLRGLWRTANRLAPATAPQGVHKFACIEDANTERAARSTRPSEFGGGGRHAGCRRKQSGDLTEPGVIRPSR